MNQRQDDWAEWLPLVEFAYNNRIHASTRRMPFEMDSGQHPRMGVEPCRSTKLEAVEEFTNWIQKAVEEARSALQQAASDMARFHDAHRGKKIRFKVGDKVWLDSCNIKTTRPSKKLDDRWFGPFPITEVISDNAYQLKLTPAFARVHPVFNITLLRQFEQDKIQGRRRPTHPEPSIDEEGETVYDVEDILDSRHYRGRLEYLIQWKGYGPEHNSWEPLRNLNAPHLIAKFHKNHPSAPRQISAIDWHSLPFKRYSQPEEGNLFDWHTNSLVRMPSLKGGVM